MLTAGVIGVGILYNEEELKKNKLPVPDLKQREYAGRLGITAPQSSMGTAALVMLARINGGGEKNIEPGFQVARWGEKGSNPPEICVRPWTLTTRAAIRSHCERLRVAERCRT